MPTVKITAKEIRQQLDMMRALQVSDVYLWDRDLKGFGCRISKKCKVTWIVQRLFGGTDGKDVRIKVGNMPPMGLDEAKAAAEIIIGKLRDGIDVSKDKRNAVAQQKIALTAPSLDKLYDEYFNRIDDGSRYRKEQRQAYDREVAGRIGHLPAAQVSKTSINGIFDQLESAGAKRTVFALLRPFFKDLVRREIIADSPMATMEQPKQPKERERVLSDVELTQYVQAALSLSYPWREYFMLLLYTSQRRQNVATMAWRELDLGAANWVIPAEKFKTKRIPYWSHCLSKPLGFYGTCRRYLNGS
jgi:hypothetical protein